MTVPTRRAGDDYPDVPLFLSPPQVAELLNVSVHTVMAWRHDKDVPLRGTKIRKHVRFSRDEVFAFLAAMQEQDGAA